jgi:hypothetical protein
VLFVKALGFDQGVEQIFRRRRVVVTPFQVYNYLHLVGDVHPALRTAFSASARWRATVSRGSVLGMCDSTSGAGKSDKFFGRQNTAPRHKRPIAAYRQQSRPK